MDHREATPAGYVEAMECLHRCRAAIERYLRLLDAKGLVHGRSPGDDAARWDLAVSLPPAPCLAIRPELERSDADGVRELMERTCELTARIERASLHLRGAETAQPFRAGCR